MQMLTRRQEYTRFNIAYKWSGIFPDHFLYFKIYYREIDNEFYR